MLEEALEHLVKGIVDHKDEVAVRRKELPKELGKPNLATVVLEVSSKAVLR